MTSPRPTSPRKTEGRLGLRFECLRCHACCRHEPGFVYLSDTDIQRLARHLGLDEAAFLSSYARCVPGPDGSWVYSLKEKTNFDCIFWKDGCTVYEARPLQCQAYPFWPRIVATPESWRNEARYCPGIDQGQEHPIHEVAEWVRRMRENRPRRCDGP